MIVRGSDVKAGDVLDVWWKPRRDTVLSLRDYGTGTLWPDGARIAAFAHGPEMTIGNDEAITLADTREPKP
jgi:hypothetical protein